MTSGRSELAALGFALTFPTLLTWVYFVLLSGRPVMGVAYGAGKIIQFGFRWPGSRGDRDASLGPLHRTDAVFCPVSALGWSWLDSL